MALILHVTPRSCVVAHDDRASDILRRPPRSIEREDPAARGAGRISGLPRPLCGLAMTYLLRHRHCEEPQATKQSSAAALSTRSEERRVGKEWCSTWRSRWSPDH